MAEKNYNATALLFKVVDAKFKRDDADTPIRRMTPTEFAQICRQCEVSHNTAYLLATFALALTDGMIGERDKITAIVGGKEGGALGGCLIVQVEELCRALGGT